MVTRPASPWWRDRKKKGKHQDQDQDQNRNLNGLGYLLIEPRVVWPPSVHSEMAKTTPDEHQGWYYPSLSSIIYGLSTSHKIPNWEIIIIISWHFKKFWLVIWHLKIFWSGKLAPRKILMCQKYFDVLACHVKIFWCVKIDASKFFIYLF